MNFLPIGSVVLLKGADHRTLIFGRKQRNKKTGECFDYVGCSYPEGILDNNKVELFNHEDIHTLFAIGYQDPEELALRKIMSGEREA